MTNSNPTTLSQVAITTDTAKEKQQKINQAYNELKNAFDSQTPIEIEIIEKTRGGFKSTYQGIPLFIPFAFYTSKKSELSDEEINSVIGSKVRVKVKEFSEDEFGKVIKVDHKEVIEDEKWTTISNGSTVEVKVKAIIKDKGIIAEMNNGLDAFIPISHISRQRINNIEDVVKIDEIIKGKIIETDRKKNRILISLKEIPSTQVSNFFDTHTIGDKITGKVETISNFAVFFAIAPGVTGFLKMKEVLWTRRHINLTDYFEVDKEYELEIINFDWDNHSVELSYKRTQPDNWQEIADKYKKGLTYSAVVEYIPPTGRGADVTINNEIDAFMPKQRAAALYNGNKPTFKAKDVIQIKIFNIDAEQHFILVESALKQEEHYSNSENSDRRSSSSQKDSSNKEKVNNFTFADLLSENSKKALKN